MMASLVNLATRKVKWRYDDGVSATSWPPSALSGSSFKVSGKVCGRPLKMEVRLDKQKGYLAGKKTSDLERKYVCVFLKPTKVGKLTPASSTPAESSLEAFRKDAARFASFLDDDDRTFFFPSSGGIRFWYKTAMGELDAVRHQVARRWRRSSFVTDGPGLVVKRLYVVTKAERDLSKTSWRTHFYGRTAAERRRG